MLVHLMGRGRYEGVCGAVGRGGQRYVTEWQRVNCPTCQGMIAQREIRTLRSWLGAHLGSCHYRRRDGVLVGGLCRGHWRFGWRGGYYALDAWHCRSRERRTVAVRWGPPLRRDDARRLSEALAEAA